MRVLQAISSLLLLLPLAVAQGTSCGSQAKGALCPDKQCCSQYGYCGTTSDFCLTSKRCQSRCINDGPPPPPAGPKAPSIDTSKLFQPPAGTFNDKRLVAYFSNWAQYRGVDPSIPGCKNDSQFLPEHINPHLYTHINYAFVFMAENYSIIPHEYDDEDLSLRMNRWVHKLNPNCKTSFSVGGWSMNDDKSPQPQPIILPNFELRFYGHRSGIDYTPFFSRMASSAANRKVFIDSCIKWARNLEFDGIDLDWEFVGDPERGGSSADKANLNALAKEMREACKAEAGSSGKPQLILTLAAPAGPTHIGYIDPKTVAQYFDWLNIMTYDFYGNWDSVVENQAPIIDQRKKDWSFSAAIDLYLAAGVPAKQIVAGLPLYGRVWTLTDPKQNTPGSPGTAGIAGRCTGQKGYLSYFEIDEIRKAQDGGGEYWVEGDGYYLLFDNQWVGYDDEASFVAKMDIINQKGLGGGMLWAIDQDTKDFNLTKTLLNTFRSCPKDGDWPASQVGKTVEIPCPDSPTFSQTRQCGDDAKWGSTSNIQCIVNRRATPVQALAQDLCVK